MNLNQRTTSEKRPKALLPKRSKAGATFGKRCARETNEKKKGGGGGESLIPHQFLNKNA